MVHFYKDNPEGYFGIGKVLFLAKDYENGIDNVFVAHLLYIENNSAYVKDSEILIAAYFQELTNIGKGDLFIEKAKMYGISLTE